MLDVWPFCDQERSLPPPIKITLPTFMRKKVQWSNPFFFFFWTIIRKSLDQTSYSKSFSSPNLKVSIISQWRIQGSPSNTTAHPPPPTPPPLPHLILRPNWDPAKGRKKSFGDHAPSHLSMGLHDRPPPPPLSQGLHPTLSRITWHAGFNLYILETWWSS